MGGDQRLSTWHVARFLAWQEECIRHADSVTAKPLADGTRDRRLAEHTGRIPAQRRRHPTRRSDVQHPHSTGHACRLVVPRFVETSPQWMAAFCTPCGMAPSGKATIAGQALQEERGRLSRRAGGSSGRVDYGYVGGERLPNLFASATCAVFPPKRRRCQAKCGVRMATALHTASPWSPAPWANKRPMAQRGCAAHPAGCSAGRVRPPRRLCSNRPTNGQPWAAAKPHGASLRLAAPRCTTRAVLHGRSAPCRMRSGDNAIYLQAADR